MFAVAAPLFTDDEIKRFITMRKNVAHEAWQNMGESRAGRQNRTILASADTQPSLRFEIEWDQTDTACSFTLSVHTDDGRPKQAIVRYDIQDNPHTNPKDMPPKYIPPGQPHRHIHTERGMREFGNWSKWAEPIQLKRESCDLLRAKFLQDLNIHFTDSQTHGAFFEGME